MTFAATLSAMSRPDDRAAAVIVAHLCDRFEEAGVCSPVGLPARARGDCWLFFARHGGRYGDVPLSGALLQGWASVAALARRVGDRIADQIDAGGSQPG